MEGDLIDLLFFILLFVVHGETHKILGLDLQDATLCMHDLHMTQKGET